MNLQKLMENLMGIKKPVDLLELTNRGFKNTFETTMESRIQIFKKGKYIALYDMDQREVVSILEEGNKGY